MLDSPRLNGGWLRPGRWATLVLLGYSGGDQVAVGVAPVLRRLLPARVHVVWLGGTPGGYMEAAARSTSGETYPEVTAAGIAAALRPVSPAHLTTRDAGPHWNRTPGGAAGL